MVALRESDIADFLKRKATKSNGVLFFGNDVSAIASGVRMVSQVVARGEEPLRLDASDLRSDPARLDDAFRSMSLLGDRRLIIVTGVDENHAAVLESVFKADVLGNFVVVVSETIKKGSKLRAAAEASLLFAAVGFYEEAGSALVVRVQKNVQRAGLQFAEGAAERLVDLCGSDRSLLEAETEKLSLYCYPAPTIDVADVDAVCGDQAEFEADAVIAAVMDGDLEIVDRIFSSMIQSGDAKSVLIMLQLHLARLEAVSSAVARGSDFMSACRAARPPIFDKQQSAAARHLRQFSGDDLGRAQVAVQQAMLQSRQAADLADAITGRCLLSLARLARQLRQRAA
jgi:DNA polymerase III subunit delta